METRIRAVLLEDAPSICAIYNHYIEHTTITFEETALEPEELARRIEEVTETYPWFVYEEDGVVLGYAYAHAYHTRSAFRHTVENAVYLHHEATGKGIGRALYGALLETLDAQGYHVVIGAIALPNDASVRLHEAHGFVKAGHLHEVGYKLGQWVDVGYWERRKA